MKKNKYELLVCDTKVKSIRGLMFRPKKYKAILPAVPIHMWFVFYPLELRWLDEKRKIIKKEIAKPFALKTFRPPKKAKFLLEVPL